MSLDLPVLSEQPQKFSDCCLGLSTTLLRRLEAFIPPSTTVLSVGSGTGLLEALLQKHHPNSRIEGVEVHSASNLTQYLPETSLSIVSGTWDLCDKAIRAACWVFVYPRDPRLLGRYLERFGGGNIGTLVWLGPIVDWLDYEPFFQIVSKRQNWTEFETTEGLEAGLLPYEMMAFVQTVDSTK